MPFLKKIRSRRSASKAKVSNNNNNNNNHSNGHGHDNDEAIDNERMEIHNEDDNYSVNITKPETKARTRAQAQAHNGLDSDLYSSSGSTEQVTLYTEEDSSSTTTSSSSLDGHGHGHGHGHEDVDEDADVDADAADADANANVKVSKSKSTTSNKRTRDPKDPYAEVRGRMEALSLHSRMVHVYHSQSESSSSSSSSSSSPSSLSPSLEHNGEPTITFFAAWTTYLGYAVLIFVGHIREVCSKIFQRGRYYDLSSFNSNTNSKTSSKKTNTHNTDDIDNDESKKSTTSTTTTTTTTNYPSNNRDLYAPLLKSFENFYTRRLYHRIQDCFNRPIASNPGAKIHVLERISYDGNKTMQVLGQLKNLEHPNDDVNHHHHKNHDHYQAEVDMYKKGEFYSNVSDERVTRHCLNLGSYNYLGFADDWHTTCQEGVLSSMDDLPISMSSSRIELGTSKLHDKVEQLVANFIGKQSCMVVNMGFNTNATTIPALMQRGDLIVSDELNHTSIVNGARTSGSAIRCFRHNDTKHLEEILKEAIVMGQPRTRRPWKKIMVIVEGIYSMEGEYCDLRNIVQVCKKYGAYVYLDEAHSIGAMGATGRGITEYTGVDPGDVDIMMGTFSKSFGGMGGYIAGDKDLIDKLRRKCAASSYHNSLSPVVCQQIISSFEVIMGLDGTDIGKQKIAALRDNSNYFRMRLSDMGLHVLGHYDSPVMPVMLYNPTKIAAFSRECLKRGLAVVVVGFPAVPILMSRARFCLSAGHSREDLDRALEEIDEIADLLKLRYSTSRFG